MSQRPMQNSTENAYMRVVNEGEILYCVFSDKLEMTIEIAQLCVNARIKFSNGISYPCLIDMRGLRSATKEAREYMAKEGAELIKAGALIVKSPLTRMLGNIFLSLNKPNIPTKLFSDEKDAREWLKNFITNEK